jgi:hypothetical protein
MRQHDLPEHDASQPRGCLTFCHSAAGVTVQRSVYYGHMADAVVFPGGRGGPMAPLPMYAGDVAERRGAQVHRHSWSERPGMGLGPQIVDWVRGEVTAALDRVEGSPLLIGKSLGTLAATVAADRSLPAVWLTPLLSEPWAVDVYARANAPFLLVGGTSDPYWDGAAARRLSPHVLEVDGANHGMYVPGPLTDSIAVLGRMVVAVEEFLEAIAWPE